MSRQSDTRLAIAAVASSVKTVGQGRAALGKASEYIQQAYSKLDSVPSGYGLGGPSLLSYLAPADLRAEVKKSLDITNDYAQRVYAGISFEGPSIGAQLLTLKEAMQVGAAMEYAREALVNVEENTETDYWDIVGGFKAVIAAAFEVIEQTVTTVLKGASNAVGAASTALFLGFWPWLLAAMIIIIVAWKSGLFKLAMVAA